MANNNKSNKGSESSQIAGRYYKPSDYDGKSQLEKGLAETHEQVGDGYFEGTIDQQINTKDNQ